MKVNKPIIEIINIIIEVIYSAKYFLFKFFKKSS